MSQITTWKNDEQIKWKEVEKKQLKMNNNLEDNKMN